MIKYATLISAIALTIQSPCFAGGADAAWWVDQRFEADKHQLENLPLASVNSNWQFVTTLSNNLIKPNISDFEFDQLTTSNFKLQMSTDLNRNNIEEMLVVGTYRTKQDDVGKFLAIVENNEIIKAFTHSGFDGFSALLLVDGVVRWYKCMECDDYDTLIYSNDYYLE